MSPTPDIPEHPTPAGHPRSGEEDLDELRALLTGREAAEIAGLRHRVEDPTARAEDVSDVLPAAVRLRTRRDSELGQALMPTVEEAIKVSVRRNPKALADAIFPVLGPAIRRAVAQAISGLIQSFDRALEQRLSLRSLRWRWEALRTGVPYGEVVLRHTLVYRVEQVFLIHGETGTLLHHVWAEDAAVQDADMIAAMLTAIQDFVADSFGVDRDSGLQTFAVADLTVRVERGPHAVLACVIRGHAPPAVFAVFQDVVEAVHLELGAELDAFRGDAAPFERACPLLQRCLESREVERERRGVSPAFVVVASATALALGWWGFTAIRAERRWSGFLGRLGAEPGLVVVDASRRGAGGTVRGLRDPMAADPESLAAAAGLDSRDVRASWEPYYAFEPLFVEQRARRALRPPPGVALTYRDGALAVSGPAPLAWIDLAVGAGPAVPGVLEVDVSGVAQAHAQRLEAVRLEFALGSSSLTPAHADILREASAHMAALGRAATLSGRSTGVTIMGRADTTGIEERNQALSLERADAVRDALVAQGVPAPLLTTVGLGTGDPLPASDPGVQGRINRSVSFGVRMAPVGGGGRR